LNLLSKLKNVEISQKIKVNFLVLKDDKSLVLLNQLSSLAKEQLSPVSGGA
jgi:hypothetical protein